jgi:hypothetical protein
VPIAEWQEATPLLPLIGLIIDPESRHAMATLNASQALGHPEH